MKTMPRRTLISAGVGALLILVLTSALIANAALQSGPAQRTATRGNAGAAGSPTSAAPHVTFSLTPTAGATGTPGAQPTPQADPTAGSGGHRGDPGSPGNPGGGGGSPTPTPAAGPTAPPAPGATPSGGPTPTTTPTVAPTPTSGIPDDAIAVGPTTPASVSVGLTSQNIALTIQNTGSNSWGPGQLYALHCSAGCDPSLISTIDGNLPDGVTVFPGQAVVIAATFYPLVSIPGANVYHPHFTMINNHNPFGADISVTITFPGGPTILQQAIPSCDNPSGVAWTALNAGGGNTISCTTSGLMIQQASQAAPETEATSVPGYDPNNISVSVHIHFSGMSSTTWAGFRLPTAGASPCPGPKFEVRPDGTWRLFEYSIFTGQTCTGVIGDSGTVSPSLDWDLSAGFNGRLGVQELDINERTLRIGGFFPGLGTSTGLVVEDATGVSVAGVFTQFLIVHTATSDLVQYVLG